MGRLPEPAYIGAVALGATVFALLFWAFGFLRMGTTGFIAQALGRNDGSAVREIIARNMVLAGVFGALILLLSRFVVDLALWLFPASVAVESAMLEYYQVRVFSAPATLANYVLMGTFVGLQKTRYALFAQLALNLTNAALSVLFVLSWEWGIHGVGLASLIAEYFALAIGIFLLWRANRTMSGNWPGRALAKIGAYIPLLKVNANIFLRTLCMVIGFGWFNAQGAGFGDVPLAVNAILIQLTHMLAYGLDGFAHAAETFVGHAIGSRRKDAYRWAIRATTQWAFGTAVIYCIIFALGATHFVAGLTTIEAVRIAAQEYIPWLIAMPLFAVWCFQLDGIFVGALRTAQMRNAMLVSTVVYIAFSLVFMKLWGNHGLWLSVTFFFVLRALTLGWYLKRKPWTFESNAAQV
jgi:MATE family multidrug resistance protein